MSNIVDPDEMAHYDPSHLALHCLQKPIVIACGGEKLQRQAKFVADNILFFFYFIFQRK